MTASRTRASDVRDGDIQLSSEEWEVFIRKTRELRKLFSDTTVKAKYKLEILFGDERSTWKPTAGALSFWANGTKLHGGGDEKLYLCPGNRLLKNGCTEILHDAYSSSRGIVCPGCGQTWSPEAVIAELLFKLPMPKWADVLCKYFSMFECHCDIYLKHAPNDIRSISLNQVQKATWAGSKNLYNARSRRARYIYPLRNIIKDTGSGADLRGRFLAFLTA